MYKNEYQKTTLHVIRTLQSTAHSVYIVLTVLTVHCALSLGDTIAPPCQFRL